MSAIWTALTNVYKVLAALPFIPFLAVYFLGAVRGMERQRAFRMAADVTTFFLIGIVAALLSQLSGSGIGFYLIMLLLLIAAGLIGNAQNRVRGKIDPPKIVRAVWRLSFFALSVLYVVLMFIRLVFQLSR